MSLLCTLIAFVGEPLLHIDAAFELHKPHDSANRGHDDGNTEGSLSTDE
jgi:hypothetical protein